MSSTNQQFSDLLDYLFDKAKDGLGAFESASVLAQSYRNDYSNINDAIEALIRNETWKATCSGFISGLGGWFTSIVLLPTNLVSVLFIQIRLVTTIAILKGHDITSFNTKWIILGCLCGNLLSSLLKNKSISLFAGKVGVVAINNLNKLVIKQLSAKLIVQSTSSFTKFIPILGGVISGGMDYYATKGIGETAVTIFSGR